MLDFTPERYEILGMKELDMDYSGRFLRTHEIYKAVSRIKVDDRLTVKIKGKHIEFYSEDGHPVARLAKNVINQWLGKLDRIREIKVVAMVERTKADVSEKKYLRYIKEDIWEMPIVEVRMLV